MKDKLHLSRILIAFLIYFTSLFVNAAHAQSRDITLTVHLRGVYESKISLLALSPAHTFKPILEVPGIKNGEKTILKIPAANLPGEFVLRFDYKEQPSSTPYPSERYFFANQQDLEFRVSPMFCNNPDSSYFQAGEKENSAYARFSAENGRKREKLGVLQGFLMNYDDTESKLYQEGILEYEKRREEYNQWLAAMREQDGSLFVSTLYGFQYIPDIPFRGTESDRIKSLIAHYFDGIDFGNPLIIKTAEINKWMDNYVNLYGQLTTSAALRDSLFPAAGINAIEKAKPGHPLVYGWMVDYFYQGYEVNGIDAGIKILEPYLDDPNCLTSKRQEIQRRLVGIETLVPGSKAPDITMPDPPGAPFNFYSYQPPEKYTLVLFWSADCEHCEEFIAALYPWQQKPEISRQLSVLAISLDETDTELLAWQKKVTELKGWKHLQAKEGVNSKVANDYFVLATPVLILVDSKTKEVVVMPKSVGEIEEAMK